MKMKKEISKGDERQNVCVFEDENCRMMFKCQNNS